MSELYYKKQGTRRTIILEGGLERAIKKLQADLIGKNNKQYSLTKIVSTLLVAGILASEKFSTSDWYYLRKYFKNKKIEVDEKIMDIFLENLTEMDHY